MNSVRYCDSLPAWYVRSRVRLLVVLWLTGACGTRRPAQSDAGPRDDASARGDAGARSDAARHDDAATSHDAPHDALAAIDAFPAVLDVRIQCRDDCVLIAQPPSIAVTAGTGFQVNWINTGDTDCDVAKIDAFNHVPIVLGLAPGTSYHDAVHEWCGALFTGTFQFEIRICTVPSYIPVNCGA
jgi:hypothetical protein